MTEGSPARTALPRRYSAAIAFGTAALAGVLVSLAITASGPVAGVPESSALIRAGLPIVRVILDVAAVVAVGLSLLPLLIGVDRPKLAEPVLVVARPLAVSAGIIWSVSALVALLLQAAELEPGETLSLGAVGDYIGTVGAGKALVAVAGLAAIHAWISRLAVRHGEKVPAELRVALGLFTLLPLPVTGHASNWRWHDFSMISMELHVMGAVAWTGGLGALIVFLSTNRTLLAHTLPRFSRLATLALLLVTATGLFNGLIEAGLSPTHDFWAALFTTGYGQLVILKVACGILLVLLGGNIRLRLMPAIAQHKRTALAGWAAFELSVMGLAFGIAVVLTRAPVS
ncbi:MAG: copper resistance protein CopD [Pseudonocardiaceae bacterium]|nr:copper resistance protein CopD [Pseudonocardiaceae bacterium]